MDPTQALINIVESLHGMQNKYDVTARKDSIESLDILSTWIKQGGFPPDVPTALSAMKI